MAVRTVIDQFDNHLSDSGFKSNFNPEKSKIGEKQNIQIKYIPYAWSFVGGLFTVQLYEKKVKDLFDIKICILLSISFCFSQNNDESSTKPLFSIRMKQPNLFVIQDAIERVEQISLYSLTWSLFDRTIFEQTEKEFGDIVLETRQGELDDTGISPTLFEFKRVINSNVNDIRILCNMRKPVQVQFTPNNLEKLFCLRNVMKKILDENIETSQANNVGTPIIRCNKIADIRKLIGNASSIEFNVTKFSINFMTSMNCLLSLAIFKWKSKVDMQKHPEQISFSTSINSIAINTDSSMLLNPMAINFDCVLTQEKWNKQLLILMNFTSNMIDLQISPNDVLTFARIQADFLSCVNRHFNATICTNQQSKKFLNSTHPPNGFNHENLYSYNLPKFTNQSAQTDEEYFQDDLRYDLVMFNY